MKSSLLIRKKYKVENERSFQKGYFFVDFIMDDKFFTCDDCLGILENEESDDEEFIRALAVCVNEGIESARKLIRSDMSESMKRAAMKINQYFAYALAYAEEIERG